MATSFGPPGSTRKRLGNPSDPPAMPRAGKVRPIGPVDHRRGPKQLILAAKAIAAAEFPRSAGPFDKFESRNANRILGRQRGYRLLLQRFEMTLVDCRRQLFKLRQIRL